MNFFMVHFLSGLYRSLYRNSNLSHFEFYRDFLLNLAKISRQCSFMQVTWDLVDPPAVWSRLHVCPATLELFQCPGYIDF